MESEHKSVEGLRQSGTKSSVKSFLSGREYAKESLGKKTEEYALTEDQTETMNLLKEKLNNNSQFPTTNSGGWEISKDADGQGFNLRNLNNNGEVVSRVTIVFRDNKYITTNYEADRAHTYSDITNKALNNLKEKLKQSQ